jgi:hypothetical protein
MSGSKRTGWRADNERSKAPDTEKRVRAMWKAAFPHIEGQNAVPTDTMTQRDGIDRFLLLSTGYEIPVEEKVRFRPFSGDVLMEDRHVFEDGSEEKGWANKHTLRCHYLGFLWVDGHWVVLPWQALRGWWVSPEGQSARAKAREVSTRNNNAYTTYSKIIPTKALNGLICREGNLGD